MIPYWAKDPTIGNRMINARAETLTDKPAFKELVGSRQEQTALKGDADAVLQRILH